MYYRRYELQKRFTLIFGSTVISGAFGGVSVSNEKKLILDEYVFIHSNSHISFFSYKRIAFCVCNSKYVRRRRL